MTTTPLPELSPARRAARVFARDLLGYTVFWAPVLVIFTIGLTVVTASLGDVNTSIWQQAMGLLRWVFLVGGTLMARAYLPLLVAHGIARRDALAGIWPVAVALCALMGLVAAAVFAIEGVVYRAFGWPHVLSDEGTARLLYERPDQYGLIAVAVGTVMLAFLVSGGLIGATYTRLGPVLGTLCLPISMIPAVIGELLVVGGSVDPEIWTHLMISAGVAELAALAACAAGIAGSALLLRDLALDNDKTEWWR
jgi:hypothetical protein